MTVRAGVRRILVDPGSGAWLRRAATVLAPVSTVAVFVIVLLAGGAPSVYLQLPYIPIILAAYRGGTRIGLAYGIACAVLSNPVLTWVDLEHNGEPFGVAWIVRGAMFIAVGLILGWLFSRSRAAGSEAVRAWNTASTALDATPDSVAAYRSVTREDGRFADGEVVFANVAALRRWFPGRRVDELRGRHLFAERPDLADVIFERYRRVAEEGVAIRETLPFETSEGLRTIDISIQPFPGGFIHVGRDVTDEHAAREALRASEERLRRMVESIDAIVAYREPGSDVPTLSAQVERLLGYRAEEVAPYEVWHSLIHPDDIARCLAAWSGQADRWDLEYRVRHADGRWVWVADRGATIRDERGIGAHGVVTDISAQRLAAERFRAVFEDNPETIVLLRPVRDEHGEFIDAEVVSANRAARETLFGGTEDGASVRLFARLGATAGHPLSDGVRGACDAGQAWKGEVEVAFREAPAWLDIAVFPYEFGVALVGRDVTDRRRAEREAEQANQRLRALFDADLFGASVADPAGRVVEANDHWLSLTGWTREGLACGEVDWRRVTAPESLAADDRAIDEIREHGRSAPFEKTYVRRDGVRVPVIVVRTAMPGEGDYLASVVLDLSAVKEASGRAERLAAAIEQTSEAVVITDPDARITYVNPAFEQVSGYTAEEALGRNPKFLQSGEHPREFYAAMWSALLRGETWKGELVNRRKDGSRYTELATFSPIRNAGGETVAYVAVKRDVTVERLDEAERRQGQRLDALGQLAGGVAHDFNNLLAAIGGYAGFVRDDLAPGSQARSDMDELLRAVDRAAALTRRLLTFTRRQQVSSARIDPAAAIGEAVTMLRRLLGEHVDLRTDLPIGQGLVLVDPAQLEHAIVNLALNARDAMPGGGVLEIRCEHVDGGSGRPVMRITVSDTGCGMDEATLARIYEPFFTTKEPGRGTGLGLAMVYGFVQSSSGTIRVASRVGEGTSFTIDLPEVFTTAENATSRERSIPGGRGELIFVVEDDPGAREVARRYLAGLGYVVRAAASPADALEILASGPRPDLLLTDVRMPGMQGPALALTARDLHPDLPVVFMSGFADAFDSGDAAIDASTVLEKPFTREALARAVRASLSGAGAPESLGRAAP